MDVFFFRLFPLIVVLAVAADAAPLLLLFV